MRCTLAVIAGVPFLCLASVLKSVVALGGVG
jgi:hypothetical protein